jgi:D-tyrosyl-tRNA(Tyr) deacylase
VVDGAPVGRIDTGLLVYVGVAGDDVATDAAWLADKIRFLRIFPDDDKPLNRDVVEAGGAVLAVSAFTTLADARKGRRPALTGAAGPDQALLLFSEFCRLLREAGVAVAEGRFRAHMDVHSVNDGPICVLLDSRRQF